MKSIAISAGCVDNNGFELQAIYATQHTVGLLKYGRHLESAACEGTSYHHDGSRLVEMQGYPERS